MPREGPLSDEDLAALLEEVEERASLLGVAEEDAPERRIVGEPCPHCGEVAEALSACASCDEDGCLPREDWQPGDGEPCLTRCERCGNLAHRDCTSPAESGNPVCHACSPAAFFES